MSDSQPRTSTATASPKFNWIRDLAIATALVALIGFIYAPTAQYSFVNFDDNLHVYDNPDVTAGVTPATLAWSFGIHGPSQWHPLSWFSHQVDCELFGLWAGGHHLVNVVLHALATLLLFAACRRLSCGVWCSAWVAAAFAVHPLNVESVAWISERRNVLTAIFWMLTLLAYLPWCRSRRPGAFFVVLAMHALALMSKPLAVTLPCTLLLLDWWPLQRTTLEHGLGSRRSARQLVVEKLPLFGLSAISSWLCIECQRAVGTIADLASISMAMRLTNAVGAYGWYLFKLVVPSDLCVFYPHPIMVDPHPWPGLLLSASLSGFALLVISAYVWFQRKRSPWLLVGWLWYLGTLVPMIGIMQVGQQQQADRYAYIPLIGIFLGVGREAQRLAERNHAWKVVIVPLGLVCISGWTWIARQQVEVWADSKTLFRHAQEVDEFNPLACNNLALALQDEKNFLDAARYLRKAIEIKPDYGMAHHNLGIVLQELNQPEAALDEFRIAIIVNPRDVNSQLRLGTALSRMGNIEEGIKHLRLAHQIQPGAWQTCHDLGVALAATGQHEEAVTFLKQAHRLQPSNAITLAELIPLLRQLNRREEAQKLFDDAVARNPRFRESLRDVDSKDAGDGK